MPSKKEGKSNIESSKNVIQSSEISVGGHLHIGDVYITKYSGEEPADDLLADLPLPEDIAYPQEPFLGIRHFSRKEARVFFGRNWSIKTLYERLTTQNKIPILLLYGPSGVGKSSLLDAGLRPRLEKQGWQTGYFRKTQTDQNTGFFQSILDDVKGQAKPSLLILDQLEELYTLDSEKEKGEEQLLKFLEQIISERPTKSPRLKIMLGFRKEYLPEIESLLISKDLLFSKFYLNPLNRSNVEDILRGMAAIEDAPWKVKYSNEDLIQQIASRLTLDDQAAVAPLLQLSLQELWQKAVTANRANPILQEEDYKKMSREGISMENFLDKQLQRFDDTTSLENGLVLDLLAFFTTDLSTAKEWKVTKVLEQYAHLTDSKIKMLLSKLKDLYLLSEPAEDSGQKSDYLRLAHDALGPVVVQKYNSSTLSGQRARRMIDNRRSELLSFAKAKGLPVDSKDQLESAVKRGEMDLPLFNKKELKIIEEGKKGMRQLTDIEQLLVRNSEKEQLKKRNRFFTILGGSLILLLSIIVLSMFVYKAGLKNNAVKIERAREYIQVGEAGKALEVYEGRWIRNYQDSVLGQLSDISANFIFENKLSKATPVLDLLGRLDTDKKQSKILRAEWAFLFSLGNQLETAQSLFSESFDVPKGLEEGYFPTVSSLSAFESHYGREVTQYFKRKYLPELAPVQGNPAQNINDFYIGKYEVTNAKMLVFLNVTDYQPPNAIGSLEALDNSAWKVKEPYSLNMPVFVKGYAATEYSKWLNGKLPSVQEWEYAARGGNEPDPYQYPGGDDLAALAFAPLAFGDFVGDGPGEVGLKKPNKLGIYDMAGNVWERCRDSNVLKGGDYETDLDLDIDFFAIDSRDFSLRFDTGENIGFRIWLAQ